MKDTTLHEIVAGKNKEIWREIWEISKWSNNVEQPVVPSGFPSERSRAKGCVSSGLFHSGKVDRATGSVLPHDRPRTYVPMIIINIPRGKCVTCPVRFHRSSRRLFTVWRVQTRAGWAQRCTDNGTRSAEGQPA